MTDAGKIMVQVKSPKGIWRNHPAEWLEYVEGQIVPATEEEARRSLMVYRGYITKMLAEIDAMGEQWGVQLDTPGQFQIVLGDDGPRIVNTRDILRGNLTREQAEIALAEFEGGS